MRIRKIGKLFLQKLPYGEIIVKHLRWRLFTVYRMRLIPTRSGVPYKRNTETGLISTEERSEDGIWEYSDMIVTNQVIGDRWLTPDVHWVINIGSGVATFESLHAQTHPDVQFVASEMDQSSTAWAKAHRSYPNVTYSTDGMGDILQKMGGQNLI